jgi:hypothetical protein
MPQFSPDPGGQGAPGASRSQHPAKFSPGAGNIGAQAAAHALRGKPQSAAPAQKGASSGKSSGQSQQFGHPDFGQAEQPQEQTDFRHVDLVGQHFNMKGLGRDVPYGVWSWLTGNYRQLAEKGRPPFDYLED